MHLLGCGLKFLKCETTPFPLRTPAYSPACPWGGAAVTILLPWLLLAPCQTNTDSPGNLESEFSKACSVHRSPELKTWKPELGLLYLTMCTQKGRDSQCDMKRARQHQSHQSLCGCTAGAGGKGTGSWACRIKNKEKIASLPFDGFPASPEVWPSLAPTRGSARYTCIFVIILFFLCLSYLEWVSVM